MPRRALARSLLIAFIALVLVFTRWSRMTEAASTAIAPDAANIASSAANAPPSDDVAHGDLRQSPIHLKQGALHELIHATEMSRQSDLPEATNGPREEQPQHQPQTPAPEPAPTAPFDSSQHVSSTLRHNATQDTTGLSRRVTIVEVPVAQPPAPKGHAPDDSFAAADVAAWSTTALRMMSALLHMMHEEIERRVSFQVNVLHELDRVHTTLHDLTEREARRSRAHDQDAHVCKLALRVSEVEETSIRQATVLLLGLIQESTAASVPPSVSQLFLHNQPTHLFLSLANLTGGWHAVNNRLHEWSQQVVAVWKGWVSLPQDPPRAQGPSWSQRPLHSAQQPASDAPSRSATSLASRRVSKQPRCSLLSSLTAWLHPQHEDLA